MPFNFGSSVEFDVQEIVHKSFHHQMIPSQRHPSLALLVTENI